MKAFGLLVPMLFMLVGEGIVSRRYGLHTSGAVYDFGPYHEAVGVFIAAVGGYMLFTMIREFRRGSTVEPEDPGEEIDRSRVERGDHVDRDDG